VVDARPLFYYLDVPYCFPSPYAQALVDVSDPADDPGRLHGQLTARGITHLLLDYRKTPGRDDYGPPFDLLYEAGCLDPAESFEYPVFASRTLSTFSSSLGRSRIFRLRGPSCLD
jgi:hypothetical protein